ncbi:MAG: hypothetical protein WBM07_11045 [Chitinivibrionales bacterium]
MNDSDLISLLSTSFAKQMMWYRELSNLVHKTLGQLVLSRGDVTQVMENFTRKQKILDMIVEERDHIGGSVDLWQKCKKSIKDGRASDELDDLLKKTAAVISEFLDGEAQLKRYLEHVKNPRGGGDVKP